MEEFMSVNEVAKTLKVHPMTVRRMIYKGELEAHKVGSNIRISRDNLDRYISNTKIQKKKTSTARSLLKFAGTWSGPKEEYDTILKAIKDSQADAEF